MPSFKTSLKALFQLGLEPLALNALYKVGLKTGYYKRLSYREPEIGKMNYSLFPTPTREAVLSVLGTDGQAALINEADEIVGGKFRMFGGELVPLQLTFNEPLHHWTDYETGKTPIPESQFPNHDVKFIWEPARFGWAFTLGRAYHITQDEKYSEAFWKYFEIFTDGNPPYLGPHWTNGQEVAIRLMSLVWAAHIFQAASASSAERREQLVQSITHHAARIPPTLIYARSQNNNHLITESAALYTAGVALDQPRWRELGWSSLNHALRTQISSYGEYIQHSTNYHRLMMQTVLWADMISRARHQRWSAPTLEALIRASHWMFSMIDPASGQTPNLGANDGALIFPLSSTLYNDFRPTVQAAARAFLRTSLPAGMWDEMSLWLGLPASEHTTDSDAYMTDHLRGKDSWGYLRASRFKSRLTHMDQLHFDLWWHGLNITKDAGTYLYNGEPPWDNPLVSTRVHNTITMDGHDQMTRGGRFLTLDWFPAYSKSLLESDEKILGRVLAYHKGYRRLGIRHERIATVFMDERWEIKDNLIFTKPGKHIFRLNWLLLDGEYEIENRELGISFRVKSKYGWITLNIKPDSQIPSSEYRVSLVRAGELIHGQREVKPYEGWVSPTYGQKLPALSLAVEVTLSKFVSFTSEFIFPKSDK
ncbi:MAG: heparinase II/III family protein [Anaerolineales bacterium]